MSPRRQKYPKCASLLASTVFVVAVLLSRFPLYTYIHIVHNAEGEHDLANIESSSEYTSTHLNRDICVSSSPLIYCFHLSLFKSIVLPYTVNGNQGVWDLPGRCDTCVCMYERHKTKIAHETHAFLFCSQPRKQMCGKWVTTEWRQWKRWLLLLLYATTVNTFGIHLHKMLYNVGFCI